MLSDEEREALEILNNTEWDGFMITIKKLIEKQSKEIEELKNEFMEKELIIDGMKEDRRIAVEEIQEQYFVNKEESEQKERKAYIKGTNDADELCNKKWNDKIKAKIEESELLIDNSQGCMSNEDLYKEFGKIEFGKSLLEKE